MVTCRISILSFGVGGAKRPTILATSSFTWGKIRYAQIVKRLDGLSAISHRVDYPEYRRSLRDIVAKHNPNQVT